MTSTILDYVPKGAVLRPQQKEALLWVEENYHKARIFLFNMPVGSGKSWCVNTIASWVAGHRKEESVILTPTKILQDQYEDEFTYYPNLKGKDNYSCIDWGGTCETGCTQTEPSKKIYCKGCPYREVRDRSASSDTFVTNYQCYVGNKRIDGIARSHVIIDEAHNTLKFLYDMYSIDIDCELHNVPENVSDLLGVHAWLGDEIDRMKQLIMSDRIERKITKYIRLKKEIERNKKEFHFEKIQKYVRKGKRDFIQVKPFTAGFLPPVLWPKQTTKKVFLFSGTIDKYHVKEMGLSGDKVAYFNSSSPIPPERRAVVPLNTADMSYKNREESIPVVAKKIEQVREHHKGTKGFIHCSYGLAKELRKYLTDPVYLWHNQDNKTDVLNQFLESEDRILIGSGMSEGIDLKGDKARWQIIVSLPYPNYGDGWVKKKAFYNSYWYDWTTVQEFVQKIGRVSRGPDDEGTTYILDSRFHKFFFKSRQYWPDSTIDAIEL